MASDSDSNGASSDGSQFLTSGSSALILAFLAIGLFVGGLLVMFAMRRYVVLSRRRAGTWVENGSGPWNWDDHGSPFGVEPLFAATIGMGPLGGARRELDVGARPELFDVHAVKAHGDAVGWEDITPICAARAQSEYGLSPVPEDRGAQTQANEEERPATQGTSRLLRPFTTGVHDFVSQMRPSRRRARSPPRPPSPSVPASTPSSPPRLAPTYLRVAVAIAMPTQQREDSGVPPYALGIADVRWSGGPLEDISPHTRVASEETGE
ncbi:hypothetical protein C8Q77DRAFT_1146774 [Trametes polyzona]|nr:hypothetical protein C8Q77DRAFT_1146774 [Trametes polyzona]